MSRFMAHTNTPVETLLQSLYLFFTPAEASALATRLRAAPAAAVDDVRRVLERAYDYQQRSVRTAVGMDRSFADAFTAYAHDMQKSIRTSTETSERAEEQSSLPTFS